MRKFRREFLWGLLCLLVLWAVAAWSIYAHYRWRLQEDWSQRAERLQQRFERALGDTQVQLGVLAEGLANRVKETGADHLPDIAKLTLLKRLYVSEVVLHQGDKKQVMFEGQKPLLAGLWRATLYDFNRTRQPQAGLEVTAYGPRVVDIEPVEVGDGLAALEVAVSLETFLKNFAKREGVELAFLVPQDAAAGVLPLAPSLELSAGRVVKILASSTDRAAQTLEGLSLLSQMDRPLKGVCHSGERALALSVVDDVEFRPASVPSVSTGSTLVMWVDHTAVVADATAEMRQTLWLFSLIILIFGGLGVVFFVRYRRRLQRRIHFFRDSLINANHSLKAEAHARQQTEERLRGLVDEMYVGRLSDMQMMALLAHQLKLNASATMGFAEILDDEMSSSRDRESVDALRQLGERLFLMAENVDLWARRDELMSASNIRPQPLRSFVERAVEVLRRMAERKKIQLEVAMEDNALVNADTLIMEVAMKNILSNAIKFSPPGSVVKIASRTLAEGLEFSVADQGQGISRVVMEKLFEPGSDKLVRGTSGEEGLGLGLMLVRWACKMQKAQLRVTSDEGQGCRVSIIFPAVSSAGAAFRTK